MRQELLPGTLDMLILKAISLAPMHGYAIAQHLRQVSQDVVQVEEGSLYPALQRLLAKGWVKVAWKETPTKRQARYYTITAAGRKRLGDEVSGFTAMTDAIWRILGDPGTKGS
jgi:PadR family transcriptional regulator, regulatory protein PadR